MLDRRIGIEQRADRDAGRCRQPAWAFITSPIAAATVQWPHGYSWKLGVPISGARGGIVLRARIVVAVGVADRPPIIIMLLGDHHGVYGIVERHLEQGQKARIFDWAAPSASVAIRTEGVMSKAWR